MENKTIYINVLLKDNKIMGWHISPNERRTPSDYYKDFYYAGESMENCDKLYKVVGIAVTFKNDDNSDLNNFIFDVIARDFFKRWEIHPNHFGAAAY